MDMLLKMDYEKRARHLRKKVPKNRIKGKEFSQPVRAANLNFEKSLEKTVNRVNSESRLFRVKISHSYDNLQMFKWGIATRSLHFSENTFKDSTSDENTHCFNKTTSWIQRPTSQNGLTLSSPNTDSHIKNKGLKSDTISRKTGSSIKAKNSFSALTAPDRIASRSLPDGQKGESSWKKLPNFSEKNINRDSRSYRKLRKRFTATNITIPDVREQKMISFHEEELQRSSDLRHMVKKLCDDIQTLT